MTRKRVRTRLHPVTSGLEINQSAGVTETKSIVDVFLFLQVPHVEDVPFVEVRLRHVLCAVGKLRITTSCAIGDVRSVLGRLQFDDGRAVAGNRRSLSLAHVHRVLKMGCNVTRKKNEGYFWNVCELNRVFLTCRHASCFSRHLLVFQHSCNIRLKLRNRVLKFRQTLADVTLSKRTNMNTEFPSEVSA